MLSRTTAAVPLVLAWWITASTLVFSPGCKRAGDRGFPEPPQASGQMEITLREVVSFGAPRSGEYPLAIDPTGRVVVTFVWGNGLQLRSCKTGRLLRALGGPLNCYYSVWIGTQSFTPDGSRFVSFHWRVPWAEVPQGEP